MKNSLSHCSFRCEISCAPKNDDIILKTAFQFQTGADCFRMLEEVQQEGNEISEMVKRLERSKGDYGVPTLSSTASTVASSMASQWLSHMKRSFKRRAMTLSEEQQQIIKKLVSEVRILKFI